MLDQVKAQVVKGRRARTPVMTVWVFSHLEDFSPVVIRTVELITLTFKEMTSKQYFEDGIVLKRWVVAFQTEFKDALMCTNSSDFGDTLSVTGCPHVGIVVFQIGR